jgi:hypothetical protein
MSIKIAEPRKTPPPVPFPASEEGVWKRARGPSTFGRVSPQDSPPRLRGGVAGGVLAKLENRDRGLEE